MAGDWAYLPAPNGLFYYANLQTGETTWERPAALDQGGAAAATPATRAKRRGSVKKEQKWVEYTDEETATKYYYNEATGESTWILPADDDDDEYDEAEVWEGTPVSDDEAAKEAAKREKRAAHRLRVLEEILSTERKYVHKLHTLKKVYIDPLRMVADVPKGAIFSHADLDAIFLNIDVISKVNDKFLEELEKLDLGGERSPGASQKTRVSLAEAFKSAAKNFKGCYTRYVNNYDAALAKLKKIRDSPAAEDKEKQRYLTHAAKHQDAKGDDVTKFLIEPVTRVLRYKLLLSDLLNHTEADDPDRPAVQEAFDKVQELALNFNEDKRATEDFEVLKAVFSKFIDSDAHALQKELLSCAPPGLGLARRRLPGRPRLTSVPAAGSARLAPPGLFLPLTRRLAADSAQTTESCSRRAASSRRG